MIAGFQSYQSIPYSMASPQCNSPSEPAIIEQVITEFFAKSLHIILESRSPSPSSSSSGRPRDKWFNLALRDRPAALENFDLWWPSNLDPLVVDVVLNRRQLPLDVARRCSGGCIVRNSSSKDRPWPSAQDDFAPETTKGTIVERWMVKYESRPTAGVARESHSGSKRSGGATSHAAEIPAFFKETYKKSIVLLRSLYVTVRLLPAYKVFRALRSAGQISQFGLSHRISSFAEPFTREEDAEMNRFSFAPVDTLCGRLSLSVSYLRSLEVVSYEPSTPPSTHFITDYVGSPMTDPLKRFQSLPSAEPLPTYVSFTGRRSWNNARGAAPAVSPSSSPICSGSRALRCNQSPCTHPRGHTHEQPPSTSSVSHNALVAYKISTSFYECRPSAPLAPSSAPSPSTHLCGDHFPNPLSFSESDPVSTPSTPGCSSQIDILNAQVTTVSAPPTSSPQCRPPIKKEPPRLGNFQIGMVLQKVLSKDGEGVLPARGFSSLNEVDDDAFDFAADGEDLTNSWNRVESSDGKDKESGSLESRGFQLVKRSPDAVVGALVRMLQTAPPLRQGLPDSVSEAEIRNEKIQNKKGLEVGARKINNGASRSGVAAPGLFKPRTAEDALEELRSYKEMKELLLRQGGSQSVDADTRTKSGGGGLT